mmetsp:Transcript_3959/g.10938  ORF Transcript_3959/g.10938 Transcript_3959/m.10938 type:complete len:263 (+) Transcript_3959:1724-2512(+)
MYFLYSSSVVAPTHRSSPRASRGFRRLPASIAPPLAPAPTMVWISSMNEITFPSASLISASTDFSRSSNSPRYLAPATMLPMSSEMTSLSSKAAGTSPSMIRRARPSTIAVLPTPGSPMITGLFLERLARIWMTRRISSSLPMTGSSFPSRAICVRSVPYNFKASYVASGFCVITFFAPRMSSTACLSFSAPRPISSSKRWPQRLSRPKARSKCSTEMYLSLNCSEIRLASWIMLTRLLPAASAGGDAPLDATTLGCFSDHA